MALLARGSATAQDTRGLRAVTASTEVAAYTRRVALVIGIDYAPPVRTLDNAVGDARAVADLLSRDYGFEVRPLYDGAATHDAILSELARLGELPEASAVLVYFAGHGTTQPVESGPPRGFLVPWDGSLEPAHPRNLPTREIQERLAALHFYAGEALSGAAANDRWRRMAAEEYRAALAELGTSDPRWASQLHYLLGEELFDLGEDRAALDAFSAALATPESGDIRTEALDYIALLVGRVPVVDLARAVPDRADRAGVLVTAARHDLAAGDGRAALTRLADALSAAPEHREAPAWHALQVDAALAAGDTAAALKLLDERYARFGPASPSYAVHRATLPGDFLAVLAQDATHADRLEAEARKPPPTAEIAVRRYVQHLPSALSDCATLVGAYGDGGARATLTLQWGPDGSIETATSAGDDAAARCVVEHLPPCCVVTAEPGAVEVHLDVRIGA